MKNLFKNDGCGISNIHEACEAYRNGLRWAGQTGGITYAHFSKSSAKEYDAPDRAGNSFWELYREISFMVMGSEPLCGKNVDCMPEGKFDCLTSDDFETIAICIKKVSKQ